MAGLIPQLVPSHELIITMDESRMVSIGKLRMEQVLIKIVCNAAKYSPGAKQILLDARFMENGDLLFSVTDQRIGISE
ncbi:hypothetical protein SAMN06265348_11227 [Pedobacter westerhofensis]|uniref:Histidine kinase-, DNA gyrase B-, and HSP90-like ATPase n=1 Tax=Pedobacter westerhofensis TaxID=425512 RepID=A0A521FG73_9SPHI|nr:hypothetical protein [Pedobacter westerhofensis]SMO95193.1 hypothetical protein SAMN06265348_11227 [Pedobacter westerhofensis]